MSEEQDAPPPGGFGRPPTGPTRLGPTPPKKSAAHVLQPFFVMAGAAAAYERNGKLCPTVRRPMPAIDDVQRAGESGVTGYVTTKRQWDEAGFGCLDFSVEAPIHYSYDYQVHGAGFVVIAWGDFEGNGRMSALSTRGRVENGVAVLEPGLRKGF